MLMLVVLGGCLKPSVGCAGGQAARALWHTMSHVLWEGGNAHGLPNPANRWPIGSNGLPWGPGKV